GVSSASSGRTDAIGLPSRGTRARVRRQYQLDPCRIANDTALPRDSHFTLLESGTQRLESLTTELRGLIEEQHATMRLTDSPGPCDSGPTTDQRRNRDRMMRRHERWCVR